MRALATLFVIVSTLLTTQLASANSVYDGISSTLLEKMNKTDILVYGENHNNSLSRELLMDLLEKGFASGQINGFTTEYVLEELEDEFQAYLNSPSAIAGSREEEQLFSKISNNFGMVWLNDETNKKFFRFLRDQKQKYQNKISICGNDILPSNRSSNNVGLTDSQIRDKQTIRFNEMPAHLLQAAIEKFKLSKDSMINALYMGYDRELLMALRSSKCLVNAKKSIIHMGASHAWSLNFNPPPQELAWESTSHFLPILLPGRKIETMYFATPISEVNNSKSMIQTLMQKADGANRESFLLVNGKKLSKTYNTNFKDSKLLPRWPLWDFVVLSDESKEVNLWAK